MSYKQYILISFILHFFLSTISYSQIPNVRVKEAIEQFKVIENPREGVENLLALSDVIGEVNDSLQGQFYLNLGIAYGQVNHADSSFMYLDKAEKIAHKTNSDFLLAMINNTKGLVFMGKAEYEASLSAYQETIRLTEGKNDVKLKDVLSKTYGNLGGVYYQLGEMDKALAITKKSLGLSEVMKDTTENALNHLRLAMVYVEMNLLDSSIVHFNKASTYYKNLNNNTMLVYAQNNLGKIYKKKGQLENAFNHYQIAYNYAQSLGEQEEYISTLLAMSSVKYELRKPKEAKEYAESALDISKKKGFANSEQIASDLLYKIALQTKNVKEALHYRNAYIGLKDSLHNVEIKERIARLETQFETEKKEKEIQKLIYEGQLKDANLSKARSDLINIIIGALAVIAVLSIVFISKQRKEKAERIAQTLQVEALQKRFMELHSSPSELSVDLNIDELNNKLQDSLTEREFETLKLCITGKTNAEIAKEMHVTVSTVKFHLRNAYSKLGVNNRKEAFRFMLKSI